MKNQKTEPKLVLLAQKELALFEEFPLVGESQQHQLSVDKSQQSVQQWQDDQRKKLILALQAADDKALEENLEYITRTARKIAFLVEEGRQLGEDKRFRDSVFVGLTQVQRIEGNPVMFWANAYTKLRKPVLPQIFGKNIDSPGLMLAILSFFTVVFLSYRFEWSLFIPAAFMMILVALIHKGLDSKILNKYGVTFEEYREYRDLFQHLSYKYREAEKMQENIKRLSAPFDRDFFINLSLLKELGDQERINRLRSQAIDTLIFNTSYNDRKTITKN